MSKSNESGNIELKSIGLFLMFSSRPKYYVGFFMRRIILRGDNIYYHGGVSGDRLADELFVEIVHHYIRLFCTILLSLSLNQPLPFRPLIALLAFFFHFKRWIIY